MVSFGCQSMVNDVKRVLLKHPKDAFQSQDKCDKESKRLNYSNPPNFNLAVAQYDSFVKLIESFGSDSCYLPSNKNTTLDSIYTHDPRPTKPSTNHHNT